MAQRPVKPASPLDAEFSGDERIVVLHGKELFLHVEHTRRLREAISDKTGGEVETVRFDGQRVQLAEVLDELRSLGLMQQPKIVVVTEADAFVKSHRAALERYAAAPVDSATLVLRAETWNKGNLDKAIAKVGRLVKCEPPSRRDAEAWLTDRARQRYDAKLDPAAAAMLIDHIGVDLGRLDTELGKLAVSVPPGGSIATERVEALVGFASDDAAWEVQDALLSGDAGKAVAKLHELVDLADQPRELITYFAADLLRKLHHAAAMAAAGTNAFTICSTLKVWPKERQQPFVQAAKRLGTARAAQLLETLIDSDRRSKSGFTEGVRGLEGFCVRFTAALR